MTNQELHKNQRVQFTLAGKLVQGLVIGDKKKKVVLMHQPKGDPDWRPMFIPVELLNDTNFQQATDLFMPVYNPVMEDLLINVRESLNDEW